MELIISIGMVTVLVTVADLVLALRGDWTGVVRITLAVAAYVAVLGTLLKSIGRLGAPAAALPVWVFWAAGAAGGLVSGLARPSIEIGNVVVSVVLASAFLASFHWLSLRAWS